MRILARTIAWTLVFAVCGGISANAQAPIDWGFTIGVSPPRFEVDLDQPQKSQAIRVINFGERPAQIEVNIHHFDLDEQGKVRLIEPTEQSLDQWIVVNPLSFALPPGESQTVRFAVRPRVTPEAGEHRAMIYFRQAPDPDTGEAVLRVVGRVGVAVYGTSGAVVREGSLHGVNVVTDDGPAHASFDLTSIGSANVRFDGQYAIWEATHYPGTQHTTQLEGLEKGEVPLPSGVVEAGRLPTLPVFPDTRRELRMPFMQVLAPGHYVLDINGQLGRTPIDLDVSFSISADDYPLASGGE